MKPVLLDVAIAEGAGAATGGKACACTVTARERIMLEIAMLDQMPMASF